MISLELSWPPTINHYFGYARGRVYLKAKGREYRAAVKKQLDEQVGSFDTITSLVRLDIEAWMPDNRKRDLDNICKALFDALTHAGVWEDDSLVDDYRIYRKREDGKLLIGGMIKIQVLNV